MQLLRLLHCIIILRSSTKHFILFMDHILAKCYLVGIHGYRNPGSSLLCTERLQVLFLDTEIVHTIKSLTMTKSHTHFEFDSMSFWYKLRWKDKRKKTKNASFFKIINLDLFTKANSHTAFSNVIRLLQEETYVKIQSVSANRHISSKDKAKHAFVADMYKKYQDGSISRAAYIATICHKYLPVDLHNQRDNGHCSSGN